jgi:DHA2 family multidrug resistance protein
MFSLLRNVGSSIGVSVVTALLTQYTQINHANLVEHVTPYNPMMQAPMLPGMWDPSSPAGVAALNDVITRQAATIAYLNDFRLMMYVVLLALPMLLLLRRPARARIAPAAVAAAD